MKPKRIFILDGHPAETSISRQWVLAYAEAAAQAGHEVRIVHLGDMDFDPDFGRGDYENWKPLEPDLEQAISGIEWAEHIVLATPMWWGSLPAKLKGFFDRAFLPGRTFDTRNKTALGLPSPMLKGRTGRMMVTADTPGFFMRLVYHNAFLHQMRKQVLGFVGITPVKITWCATASEPKAGAVEAWLKQAALLGKAGA